MHGGTNFKNSYLGHMGSETVVTHNVITSGKLPKNMGWTDEGYRDVDGVLAPKDNDPSNDFYLPGDLSKDQLYSLQNHSGNKKLQDYLHDEVSRQAGRHREPQDLCRMGLWWLDVRHHRDVRFQGGLRWNRRQLPCTRWCERPGLHQRTLVRSLLRGRQEVERL